MINFCQPTVGDDELDAVRDVFASNWLGNGPRTAELERAFAEHLGRPPAEVLAVSSCTEGLFQAVTALGLGPGDEVVLPTVSFVGAAHAVRSQGATVVLCDVDPATLNPTAQLVERVLTAATKAILVLHFAGDPGAVGELAELAVAKSLFLVEDAALGLAASVGGRPCGTLGDVGVWSFDAMKVMTTGDGGMVWCRTPEVADRIRMGVRMGVGSSGLARSGASGRWWEIDPTLLGRRATMNDVAAAIGLVQLRRLEEFVRRRRAIAEAYDAALAKLDWLRPVGPRQEGAVWTFYGIRTAPGVRDRLAAELLDSGIYTNFRYWPLHRMAMYRGPGSYPGGDEAAATTLLLPLHAALTDADVERVIGAVSAFVP